MENLTVHSILEGYQSKEFSPTEITNYYLKRIESFKDLNAYITVLEEEALKQAEIAEKKIMNGEVLGKLEGVPISYKDNIYTKGIKTTSGSRIDRDFIPTYNAGIVEKLQREGTINLGKVNMHEYAFGITSNNPFYGPVRNPWNRDYTPGGSSGGSGAAVAADLCAVSIGTDTGGSIRIPAAACGIAGLKPTINYIDASGVKHISWTLDHVGPLTKDITDLAIVMEALTNETYKDALTEDIRGIRIGVPKNYFNEKIHEDILQLYHEALKNLESLGAILIEVEIPKMPDKSSTNFTIAVSEARFIHEESINHHLDSFGTDVRQKLESGQELKAIDYIKALKTKESFTREFNKLFSKINLLVTPTIPVRTQKIGVEEVVHGTQSEDLFSAVTRYASLFNLTGNPALSIPCGFDRNSLPVGIQFVGANFSEKLLIQVAYSYERNFLKKFYERRKALTLGSQQII